MLKGHHCMILFECSSPICSLVEAQYKPCGCRVIPDHRLELQFQRILIISCIRLLDHWVKFGYNIDHQLSVNSKKKKILLLLLFRALLTAMLLRRSGNWSVGKISSVSNIWYIPPDISRYLLLNRYSNNLGVIWVSLCRAGKMAENTLVGPVGPF